MVCNVAPPNLLYPRLEKKSPATSWPGGRVQHEVESLFLSAGLLRAYEGQVYRTVQYILFSTIQLYVHQSKTFAEMAQVLSNNVTASTRARCGQETTSTSRRGAAACLLACLLSHACSLPKGAPAGESVGPPATVAQVQSVCLGSQAALFAWARICSPPRAQHRRRVARNRLAHPPYYSYTGNTAVQPAGRHMDRETLVVWPAASRGGKSAKLWSATGRSAREELISGNHSSEGACARALSLCPTPATSRVAAFVMTDRLLVC